MDRNYLHIYETKPYQVISNVTNSETFNQQHIVGEIRFMSLDNLWVLFVPV